MTRDALKILRAARYAALDEIVARGIAVGKAIQRGDRTSKIDAMPSIYDAVEAYYISRSAYEKVADAPVGRT